MPNKQGYSIPISIGGCFFRAGKTNPLCAIAFFSNACSNEQYESVSKSIKEMMLIIANTIPRLNQQTLNMFVKQCAEKIGHKHNIECLGVISNFCANISYCPNDD